ncbi:HAD family hydrolase [Candidatus Solirubrobacter pratensis]|uniref:HAD family hydrolase n=1 Tax=Candidatus Solirubrobacter pratensis TaxID=1298857 RepID=UPI000413FDBE|nr:HAD family phosphatase [Candidatus Solirubrobacter pratensis]
MPANAVIFDCDGTLVDSEPLAGRAWKATVAPYGYEVTDADLAACMGIPYARTHAYLSERAELPEAHEFWPLLKHELFSLIDAELVPFPDAVEAAAELHARGVRLAVASSSPRERLDRTLARAGLSFAVTVAGDEVEHGKPAPDMFLAAAERLELPPARCVVVEDSVPGVAAGRAARMPTLGVQRERAVDLSEADAVVEVITAEAILALLD